MKSLSARKVGNDLLYHALAHGDVHEVLALIREEEADVNARNINGHTPLHVSCLNQFAVQFGNNEYVSLLLKSGADPNLQEHSEVGHNTPLHRAVEQCNIQIVETLVSYNADPNIKNKAGFTPLHVASRLGFTDITKFLITKGVDANIRDVYGNSASYWAKENKHTDICEVLPAPLKISKEEYYNHIKSIWKTQGFKPGGKKGGKKKGKKKKK